MHDYSRSEIREFKSYLESKYTEETNKVLTKVLRIISYTNKNIKKLFSDDDNNDDAFHLYEEFLQDEKFHDDYLKKIPQLKKKFGGENGENEKKSSDYFRKTFHKLYSKKCKISELKISDCV